MIDVGVDIGGTFTDLVAVDRETGRASFGKSSTTPADFTAAIASCLAEAGLAPAEIDRFVHGTTLPINIVIQRRGARVALVTTEGFQDVIELGRGNRPNGYDLTHRVPKPLVPRHLRFEIAERTLADGSIRIRPDAAALDRLRDRLRSAGIEAIAVCLLHAYKNDANERAVADVLRMDDGAFVSVSSELSKEWREYERSTTAVVNAYVGPEMFRNVLGLDSFLRSAGFDGRLRLMGSNGGTMPVSLALQAPVAMLESGPVAGIRGAAELGTELGFERLISFDMGGTTAKAALIESGATEIQPLYYVGGYADGYPVQVPVVDIIEVGAGGGSIASVDAAGGLHVGPRSAGAVPGPMCYGQGGTEPTVTDANVLLGRIPADNFLGGRMTLYPERGAEGIGRLAATLGLDQLRVAAGIVRVATLVMATCVRRVSIERGRDPRDFVLVAQGGGGPLHATLVARELGIRTVLVPNVPAHFSALGMVATEGRRDVSRTFLRPLLSVDAAEVESALATLSVRVRSDLEERSPGETSMSAALEMRYQGQDHTMRVPLDLSATDLRGALRARFEDGYERRYGHRSPHAAIEIVKIWATGIEQRSSLSIGRVGNGAPRPGGPVRRRPVYFDTLGRAIDAPVYDRTHLRAGDEIHGPSLIEEATTVTLLESGDVARVADGGTLVVGVGSSSTL